MSCSTLLRKHVANPKRLQRLQLHTSSARCDRVAPPHPISHMRPIIYDDAPPGATPPTLLRHPYSLNEFQNTRIQPADLELQFKLQRQQLDTFHQDFWLDVRCLFSSYHNPLYTTDSLSLSLATHRTTFGTTPQKKQRSPTSRIQQQTSTRKTQSPSSSRTGTSRRRSARTSIPRNGGNGTLPSFD